MIPEYFCDPSLAPLRKSGLTIRFYRINCRLEPDIHHLNIIIRKQGAADVLLFVHYFGIPLGVKDTSRWCKEHGVLLVEDAAHSMVPVPGIGDNGWPVIYTPWKFFNLLEGAVVVLPRRLKDILKEPEIKKGYSPAFWRWLAKRIAHTTAGRMNLPLHKLRKADKESLKENHTLTASEDCRCASSFVAILGKLEKQLESFRAVRERNYRCLDKAFSGNDFVAEPVFSSLPDKFGPYVYPLRIRNGRCWELMASLNRRGVPALPWGDLSPEVLNLPDFALSNALWREVLTLPVHQHLTKSQMDRMAREVINLL
ncbi:MAG: hypothetical protein ABIG61_16230 [Planctomycetota bacterium]